MKVIVIIPSRYNSTRFKGKALKLICGKPMIRRVYDRILLSNIVDDVYVATDDKRIYDYVVSFGGNVIMTSLSHESGTDRVAEAVNFLTLNDDDIIINVQGDQPFIDPRCIKDLLKPFFDNEKIKMSTLALKIKNIEEVNNPRDVKVIFDFEGFALYFSRSVIPYNRDINTKFSVYKHLGVYAYKKHFLKKFNNFPLGNLEKIEKLEQLRVLENGYRIFVSLTMYDSPEVDFEEDIKKIENNKKIFF